MFSGKTTELIRRLKRYQIAKYRCLIVKYANDVRYEKNGLATHDQQTISAVSAVELTTMKHIAGDYDVIGIDEGQFVSSNSMDFLLDTRVANHCFFTGRVGYFYCRYD